MNNLIMKNKIYLKIRKTSNKINKNRKLKYKKEIKNKSKTKDKDNFK